eukprot:g3194.t1
MDLERLSSAVQNDDSATIEELLRRQGLNENVESNEAESVASEFPQESFFKLAVKEFKTEWIQYFLKQIIKKNVPFCNGAQMMKENFKNLWMDYWISIEPMLKKDVLGWDVCTISVPLETFTNESNVGTRVGTCNSIVEWVQSSKEETSVEHWKKLNEEGVEKLLKTRFGFTMYMALLDFYSEIEWGGDPYNWKHDFCSTYSYYDYDAWRVSPRSYYCRLLNCHHYSNDCPDVTEIQWDKIDLLQFIQHWFIPDMFRFQYNAASKVEDLDDIKKSFGTPLRSILTMAYAMVGLFDPKVLLECGYATWLVIPIFVLYLALQTIVMFNLLIAAMGDAFDGVRASEEESFLMTRAEAIDQFEASLGNIGINAIEEKIGKYLYVLVLEDKQLEKSVPFWKGRMRTIKEDVRKIVLDSHEEMTQKIDQQSERIDQQGQNINQLNEKMDSLAQKMDLLTENMNGMFKILKDDIRSLDGRIKTLEK